MKDFIAHCSTPKNNIDRTSVTLNNKDYQHFSGYPFVMQPITDILLHYEQNIFDRKKVFRLRLASKVIEALKKKGFSNCTQIQALTLPITGERS